jgi:Protein of unknown function (DUF4242)
VGCTRAALGDLASPPQSYAVIGGELGTVCIYEGSSGDAVRRHADRVGMPADEVRPIADTVIIRPDPESVATA